MLWDDLYLEVKDLEPKSWALRSQRPFLYIDSAEQRLDYICREATENCSYPVSTSKRGLGNESGSFKTPSGLHQVKQKIGSKQPYGMIFKARKPTYCMHDARSSQDEDNITSRILWLDGLEPGLNKGGVCDTFRRYIYIHGTTDEKHIGDPVSQGCIRMRNRDVIALFDRVRMSDLVVIR